MTTEDRAGDRDLWQPEDQNLMASPSESERVRGILIETLQLAVDVDEQGEIEDRWSRARGDFAREWVSLAARLGLKGPGEDQRTPLRDGETAIARKIDAARTRLRQFLEGHNEQDWVLVGIESVCADRKGMALPGKAYQTQQKLEV